MGSTRVQLYFFILIHDRFGTNSHVILRTFRSNYVGELLIIPSDVTRV
jgi:hypothetical protein